MMCLDFERNVRAELMTLNLRWRYVQDLVVALHKINEGFWKAQEDVVSLDIWA